MKKKLTVILLIVSIVFAFTACDKNTYKKANEAMAAGNYKEAVELYSEISDYEDSADKLKEAQRKLMFSTYEKEVKLLEANWWVINGGTSNALNYYEFKDGNAKIGQVYFDGNGMHEGTILENVPYEIDDKNITTQTLDEKELKIPYTVTDGKIELDGGKYFSPEMVHEGVKGYWKHNYFDYLAAVKTYSRGEYNIKFEDKKVVYEYAALSSYDYNSYFYYGPYKGEYTVAIGTFDGKVSDGSGEKELKNMWYYNIIDGKVKVLRYNNVCTKGKKLPGQDGYYHLIP